MLILKKPSLIERLIRHFSQVNQCDRKAFERQRAYKKWGRPVKREWKLDFGIYSELVPAANGHEGKCLGGASRQWFSPQAKATLHELCRVDRIADKPDGISGTPVECIIGKAAFAKSPTIAEAIS
jgi:hypothetical protein